MEALEIITITYKKPDRSCKITDLGDGFKRIRIPLIRRLQPYSMFVNTPLVVRWYPQ
jgi:hypothetical protein